MAVEPRDVRKYATSVALYGAVVAPALWLVGGARGARWVAGSLAAGGAVVAINTFAQLRTQRAQLAAPAGAPALAPTTLEHGDVIDVLGTTLGGS